MAVDELETLRQIRQINADFPQNEYVKSWKEKGGEVVGWICTYAPEELIHAAGLLPVRVWGGFSELSLEKANAYFYPTSCSAVRNCFELALEGKFDFLDGLIMASPCEHAHRLYDVWDYWLPYKFDYAFSVVFLHGKQGISWYYEELIKLRDKLESVFGIKITDEALKKSIRLYNRTRELLRSLNELRKADVPAISGAEALEVMNACLITPKDEFNSLLETLLEEVKSVNRAWDRRPRLMITGSTLNSTDFIRFIEDQGCFVVVEELCTGIRYWADRVESSSDPLQALAERYVNRFPCHHFYPWEPRLERVVETAREYQVDGVINELIRYCVALGYMRPEVNKRLRAAGFPTLDVEIMYGSGGSGQLKTRFRAFLEMICEDLMELTPEKAF